MQKVLTEARESVKEADATLKTKEAAELTIRQNIKQENSKRNEANVREIKRAEDKLQAADKARADRQAKASTNPSHHSTR